MLTKRIEYIDLMKGICIILVIMVHCDITYPWEKLDIMIKNFRIPLYFFLSGLFFKKYDCFEDFLIRKVNKLVIPYVFFSVVPFCFGYYIYNDFTFESIIPIIVTPYNYPLWFLRCLFITYIIYYILSQIDILERKKIYKFICILLLSYLFFKLNIFLHNTDSFHTIKSILCGSNFIAAIIALPFFFIASILRRKGILNIYLTMKARAILTILFFCLWIITDTRVDFYASDFGKNFLFLYPSAIGGIGIIWLISYTLKKLPYISYVGRYSLIALGTHIFIKTMIGYFLGINEGFYLLIMILILLPIFIYLLKKYFPYFTAQKDLIKYNDIYRLWHNINTK